MLEAKSFFIKVIIIVILALISVVIYNNQSQKSFKATQISGGFENLKGGKDDFVKNPMPGSYNIFTEPADTKHKGILK